MKKHLKKQYSEGGKIIPLFSDDEDGDTTLLWLTDRQRQILLKLSTYIGWVNRWKALPTDLNTPELIHGFAEDTQDRLMDVVEFCAEMIKCLDNDEDTQTAIQRIIDRYNGGSGNPAGQKLTPTEENRNIVEGSNPTCDHDVLYAQCYYAIKMTHDAIMDFIQKVLTVTNATEFVENFWNSIPLLAVIDDVMGVQGLIDMFQYVIEAIGEGYEAQFTETPLGTHDRLAYDLFCICKPDCNITVDRIVRMLSSRLAVYTSPPSLDGLVNFLEQAFLINQDTSFVVDLMFYTAWGLVDVSAFLMGLKFDRLLQVVIRMKADEPNNDWETLQLPENFGDCPNCGITNTIIEGTEVI